MATGIVEMREVETFFKNKGIRITSNNAWLRSCVECFRTQYNNYGIKELLDFVYEQWLLADLSEIRSSSLPVECNSLDKFTIVGKHAVQLNYCIDIGTSNYSQLQKIRHPGLGDNLSIGFEREAEEQSYLQKDSSKRSLKLEVFDGQLTVIAFEDKPIPCLKNPVPGEKALLKGPIECRKGVLLLTDKNIEILGGEVDTLLIPNAVENVLARILNQPENPNPYKQDIESMSGDENKILSNCLDEDNEALLLLAESMDMSEQSHQTETQTPFSNSNIETVSVAQSEVIDSSLEFDDDDFDLVAAQTALLAEAEASKKRRQDSENKGNSKQDPVSLRTIRTYFSSQSTQPKESTSTGTKPSNSSDTVEYIDMNDPKRLKKELEQSYGSSTSYYKSQPSGSSAHRAENKSDSGIKETSSTSFSSFQLPTKKSEENRTFKCEITSKNTTQTVSTKEVQIRSNTTHSDISHREIEVMNTSRGEQLMNNSTEDSPMWPSQDTGELDSELSDPDFGNMVDSSETFHQPYPPRKFPALRVVHGQVIRLSEKLSLKNDQWCLAAMVSAKGLEMEMTFASEVLDKIFGVTAAELIARKNDLKSNPAAKEQMNKLLRDSQLRIKNLNCEMVIRFPSVIAKPVIIDVIQK